MDSPLDKIKEKMRQGATMPITKAELARRCGVSRQCIQNILSGRDKASGAVAFKIASALYSSKGERDAMIAELVRVIPSKPRQTQEGVREDEQ